MKIAIGLLPAVIAAVVVLTALRIRKERLAQADTRPADTRLADAQAERELSEKRAAEFKVFMTEFRASVDRASEAVTAFCEVVAKLAIASRPEPETKPARAKPARSNGAAQ